MNYFYFYRGYFNADSLTALTLSLVFFAAGAFFLRKNMLVLKFALFLGGISIAYFSCSLDPFLHFWDEQYHALVAKNMSSNMLEPVLYRNPLLVPDVPTWSASHIWLHKQPLFMWQMSVSMKLFGVNELALRLPGIIGHGLLLIMLFDIGRYFKNELTGFLLAVIFAYMRFPLIYVAGMEATDHNDYMFLFYVTASFWAFFKYTESSQLKYLLLIGVFAGCAVLVKWLTGLLVIGVWFSYTVVFERKNVLKSIVAFGIALLVFLPWQSYCFLKYKPIFLQEMKFNSQHITQTLEGHGGDWTFHFKELENLYTDDLFIYFILGFSILYFAFKLTIDVFIKYSVLMVIILVYGFFTIVKTKMPAFCIVTIPFVLLTVVLTVQDLMDKIKRQQLKTAIVVLFTIFFASYLMNPSYFLKRHTLSFRPNEQMMAMQIYQKTVIKSIGKALKNRKVAVVNAGNMAVRIMFYTDFDATDVIPTQKKLVELKNAGFTIVAFNHDLPEYILQDQTVIKL